MAKGKHPVDDRERGGVKRTREPLRKTGPNGGCRCQQSVRKESMVIRSQDEGGKLCRPFQALHRDGDGKARIPYSLNTEGETHEDRCPVHSEAGIYP